MKFGKSKIIYSMFPIGKRGGDVEWDWQTWLGIGLVAAAILIIGIAILTGKGSSAISFLKDWSRLG